jgi:hypothetical protein
MHKKMVWCVKFGKPNLAAFKEYGGTPDMDIIDRIVLSYGRPAIYSTRKLAMAAAKRMRISNVLWRYHVVKYEGAKDVNERM